MLLPLKSKTHIINRIKRVSNLMLAPSYFEKLYNKSYFEAGRRPRKRSLLGVNEHFEGKPDAKRALLDSFFMKILGVA